MFYLNTWRIHREFYAFPGAARAAAPWSGGRSRRISLPAQAVAAAGRRASDGAGDAPQRRRNREAITHRPIDESNAAAAASCRRRERSGAPRGRLPSGRQFARPARRRRARPRAGPAAGYVPAELVAGERPTACRCRPHRRAGRRRQGRSARRCRCAPRRVVEQRAVDQARVGVDGPELGVVAAGDHDVGCPASRPSARFFEVESETRSRFFGWVAFSAANRCPLRGKML